MQGNGGQNWGDYGQQYGQQPDSNSQQGYGLNFVSTSFTPQDGGPGTSQAVNMSQSNYNNYNTANATTSSFDDEPPLLVGTWTFCVTRVFRPFLPTRISFFPSLLRN